MKLRTSSSKSALLKKDLTRFAPFWGLYILCLLLGLMTLTEGDRDRFYFVMNLGACARVMTLVNCGYGLLTAQLLFGDLYDSRMCGGLHSLPLRREEIFGVHVLSGLLFSLVPTAIMTLVAMPMAANSTVIQGWQMPLLWFAAANLEYLLFFGMAVFCCFLVGNRFSMAVIYGILNVWSMLTQVVVETLYGPILPGVRIPEIWSRKACPWYSLSSTSLVIVQRKGNDLPGTLTVQPEAWVQLGIWAAVGLVLLGAALLLYRRRRLETAGEFLAVKPLKPVFLTVFALAAASCFDVAIHMFGGGDISNTQTVLFCAAGLLVGWFVACMLTERTTRVFRRRNLLGGGLLLVVLLGSLVTVRADPLGIQSWVPQAEDVAWVRITDHFNSYAGYAHGYMRADRMGGSNYFNPTETPQEGKLPTELPDRITDLGDITLVTELHQLALDQNLGEAEVREYGEKVTGRNDRTDRPQKEPLSFSLEYTMKDGSVVRRFYYIWNEGRAVQLYKWLFSRPQVLFGGLEELFARKENGVAISGSYLDRNLEGEILSEPNITALKQAILKDCEEGHMAQDYAAHSGPVFEGEEYVLPSIHLSVDTENGSFWVMVYRDSAHTMQWIRDQGILDEIHEGWLTDVKTAQIG